jgi:hypothetical protein
MVLASITCFLTKQAEIQKQLVCEFTIHFWMDPGIPRNWRNYNLPTTVGSHDIKPQVPILAAQATMPDNEYVPLSAAQPLER